MKKSFALMLVMVVVIAAVFAACTSNAQSAEEKKTTVTEGLHNADTEYGTEIDKDGKEVDVVYEKDKNGKVTAYVLDKDGKKKKDKNGKEVTVAITQPQTPDNGKDKTTESTTPTKTPVTDEPTSESPTGTTKKDAETTENDLTTLKPQDDRVPKTSATGKEVSFSAEDQQRIATLLEVPGLTNYSYENSDGVKAELAVHVAIWMAQRSGQSGSTYPSGTVVLDLFKYFGQTVVNFKSDCNRASEAEKVSIKYDSKDDVFKISGFEKKKQDISIIKIEHLGNNNYYKVTAKVSGVKGVSRVAAVIQKNRLDSSLGFSVKALNWA